MLQVWQRMVLGFVLYYTVHELHSGTSLYSPQVLHSTLYMYCTTLNCQCTVLDTILVVTIKLFSNRPVHCKQYINVHASVIRGVV